MPDEEVKILIKGDPSSAEAAFKTLSTAAGQSAGATAAQQEKVAAGYEKLLQQLRALIDQGREKLVDLDDESAEAQELRARIAEAETALESMVRSADQGGAAVHTAMNRGQRAVKGVSEETDTLGKLFSSVTRHIGAMVGAGAAIQTVTDMTRQLNEALREQVEIRKELARQELTAQQRVQNLAFQLGDVSQAGQERALALARDLAAKTGLQEEQAIQLAFSVDVAMAEKGGIRANLPAAQQIGAMGAAAQLSPEAITGLVELLSTAGKLGSPEDIDRALSQIQEAVGKTRGTFQEFIEQTQKGGTQALVKGVGFEQVLATAALARQVAPGGAEAAQAQRILTCVSAGGEKGVREFLAAQAKARGLGDFGTMSAAQQERLLAAVIAETPADILAQVFPGEALQYLQPMFAGRGVQRGRGIEAGLLGVGAERAAQMRESFAGTNVARERKRQIESAKRQTEQMRAREGQRFLEAEAEDLYKLAVERGEFAGQGEAFRRAAAPLIGTLTLGLGYTDIKEAEKDQLFLAATIQQLQAEYDRLNEAKPGHPFLREIERIARVAESALPESGTRMLDVGFKLRLGQAFEDIRRMVGTILAGEKAPALPQKGAPAPAVPEIPPLPKGTQVPLPTGRGSEESAVGKLVAGDIEAWAKAEYKRTGDIGQFKQQIAEANRARTDETFAESIAGEARRQAASLESVRKDLTPLQRAARRNVEISLQEAERRKQWDAAGQIAEILDVIGRDVLPAGTEEELAALRPSRHADGQGQWIAPERILKIARVPKKPATRPAETQEPEPPPPPPARREPVPWPTTRPAQEIHYHHETVIGTAMIDLAKDPRMEPREEICAAIGRQ